MTVKVDKYNSIRLNYYGDTVSIELGWEGRDGEFKASWCKREMGKDKIEKKIPMRIPLGTVSTAADNLRELLKELPGGEDAPF